MIEAIEWIRCTCERCGAIWIPRSKDTPKQCAECRRRDWNRREQTALPAKRRLKEIGLDETDNNNG